MPVSPADLRGMLRADAVGLVLGLLDADRAGHPGVVQRAAPRRVVALAGRLRPPLRLPAPGRAAIVRLSFDVSTDFWERIDAAMTYMVPIPFVLFARDIFPACLASGRRARSG